MKRKHQTLLLFIALIIIPTLYAQKYRSITSGVAWFDQNNNEVNAHGSCIVKEGDLYYLFGEYKTDTSNCFVGVGCYSSPDLKNWKFEKLVLTTQKDGIAGPDRVGERPKVMKCPMTGEFVLYMHCDDLKYNDPNIGYATCKTINGDYKFQGALQYNGQPVRRWDIGCFTDQDQKGYLLSHEGNIYELADDYKSVKRIVIKEQAKGGESPAMFKHNGIYYWLFSNKTSWERNDNYYLTARSLEGPWERKGLVTPQGTITYNSQCSFILPIVSGKDTLFLYTGDRWSFPKQGSAATYVWQPIRFDGEKIEMNQYYQQWLLDLRTLKWKSIPFKGKSIADKAVAKGEWLKSVSDDMVGYTSTQKGSTLTYTFKGKQIALKGTSNKTSAYASLTIKNSKGEEVINTIVDFYSLIPETAIKFISPEMKKDTYTLQIEVLAERPIWKDKRVNFFGSTGDALTVTDVLVR